MTVVDSVALDPECCWRCCWSAQWAEKGPSPSPVPAVAGLSFLYSLMPTMASECANGGCTIHRCRPTRLAPESTTRRVR
jgi:hypothetical protein